MWVATLSLKNPIKVLIFFLLPHPLIVGLFMLCLTLPYSHRSAPITGTLFYSLSRPPQNHVQQGLSWASSSLGVTRPSLSRCGFMWYHHRHCLLCNTSLPLSQSCDMSSLPEAGTSAYTPKRIHFSRSVIHSFQQLYSGANVFFLLISVSPSTETQWGPPLGVALRNNLVQTQPTATTEMLEWCSLEVPAPGLNFPETTAHLLGKLWVGSAECQGQASCRPWLSVSLSSSLPQLDVSEE